MSKVILDFRTITKRIDQIVLPEFDHVVGIANGGTVAACLLAYKADCSASMIHVNYRSEDNNPQRPTPALLNSINIPAGVKRILLVDDVCVSGKTMTTAREALAGYTITTFVLKGQADIVAFPEISECVAWPWKTDA